MGSMKNVLLRRKRRSRKKGKVHAIERAKQRFGLRLTRSDIELLEDQIKSGRVELLKVQFEGSGRVELYRIFLPKGGKQAIAVFDCHLKCITTLMSPE